MIEPHTWQLGASPRLANSFSASVDLTEGLGQKWVFPQPPFVKMYYFALDLEAEMPYPLAPPQGWEAVLFFENLANSKAAVSS